MDETNQETITGIVEHIVFQNFENGYTVLELSTEDELFTVTGILPGIKSGENITVSGVWKDHPSFGMQFNASSVRTNRPETSGAILKYLSSGAIKGIGPSTAEKLVKLFGENTLEIMENEPNRICVIKGISPSRAAEISRILKEENGMREMLIEVGKYGISPIEAVRIWRIFGSEYLNRIQQNPYCLCDDDFGIDFYRCDKIGQSLEKPADNISRIRAGIVYVLKHNLGNGHTCLPLDKLSGTASVFLSVDEEIIVSCINDMLSSQMLCSAVFDGKTYIYLIPMYKTEEYIAQRLKLMERYPAQSIGGIENYIKKAEKESGIMYAQLQKEAIRMALDKGLLVLTGGPGTGKTTILKAIISILKEKGEKVLLCAPTGRAAKRMSELTGEEAKTIHRLLQVAWDKNDKPVFSKNEEDMLECDALIVDELSMVDSYLFESLLRALPLGCRLVLVGDSDQLPSVGAGNVLGDIIKSNTVPTVMLTEIFRQAMQSLIVTNSHKVVSGQMPVLSDKRNDFFFMPEYSADRIAETIVSLFSKRLPAAYGYSTENDIQVLCPGRKGELGTYEINKKLQAAVNPPDNSKKELKMGSFLLREGDKVIQTKNNYEIIWSHADGSGGQGVFNGDIGTVISIDKKSGAVLIKMDERYVAYDFENIKEIELAYALTVHKSQGNEFPAVIMPMYRFSRQLIYRNLFYTAITRAKNLIVLVGDENIVMEMVKNDKKTKRYTGLEKMLEK